MHLQSAYTPNYFAIDDILATQERTPCKFLVNVPKLGVKLNPASEKDDIQPGTSLELPMWLVQPLGSGRQPVVSVELPRMYKEAYREVLKADPNAVDLHKFSLYFYELGAYAKEFDSRGDVAEILLHSFKGRFRKIMDLAHNTASDSTTQDSLDMLERMLYNDGHKARMKLNAWLISSGIPLVAANMVINHRKRKRVDIEDII
ncbi:hypothetical protein AMK59_5939 [Oryctes borbonicus]|uniref:DNA replication complex GINS protein PSF3 n=1 Tax=Oryctes borbonicus TaxID=1629725 RepID=A0A0T6B384_9SCAR|nr:hypothetical protein AMK59_5939 [Oryctes borbonicus]